MKKISKVFAVALTILLVVSVMPLSASAVSGGPPTGITITSADLGTLSPVTIPSSGWGTPASDIPGTASVSGAIPGATTLAALPGKNIIENVTLAATGADVSDTPKFFVLPTGKSVNGMTGAQIQAAAAFSAGAKYLSDGDTIVLVVGKGTVSDFGLAASELDVYAVKVTVTSGASGSVGGDASVKSPTIVVDVPLAVDFALNPLQVGTVAGDSQITSTDYPIVNKSEAPVKVSFALTAVTDSTVTLVTDKTVLKPSEVAEKAKKLYFAVLSAGSASTATGISPTGFAYDPTKVTTLRLFEPADANVGTDGTTDFEFLLNTSGTHGTPTTDNKGVASFQFYAVMNTYAPWSASDLSISGSYHLDGVRTTDYSTTVTSGIEADSLNLLKSPTDVTIAAGETKPISRSMAAIKNDGINISLTGAPSLTTVKSGTGYTYPSTAWTYDSTTGILNFHYEYTSATSLNVVITTANGVHTLALTVTP
jgi:hypothetical protein